MTTLHDPERHARSQPGAWDPSRVQAWLARWATDALAIRASGPWPIHPRDADDVPGPASFHCLYFGAAGVWMALARLAAAGYCRLPVSLPAIFAEVLQDYETTPDTGERVPSWFLGESALLTACCLAGADADAADRLAATISANRANPTREALWGAPGTMIAALFMYEAAISRGAAGAERWAALYRDSAAALWASWDVHEATGAWTWQQDLYGQQVHYVGAGHGWAGNLYPLWRGLALLDEHQQRELYARTVHGLDRLALRDGALANWPTLLDHADKTLVQWCHGAPGIITSLRHAALPEALPLLLAGGRLIVHAGPLRKGVALCHGTDGNGVALLELYRRTRDPAWLAHARAFAMVALDRSEADHAEYAQWHHSLLTGDAGLACFLLDCFDGKSRGMPGLDVLW